MFVIKIALVFYFTKVLVMGNDASDWTQQCGQCKCKWSEGRKYANCTDSGYSSIPQDLSNEIRIIDFSQNKLYELKNFDFSSKNLSDVHKLKLNNCSITMVNNKAFDGVRLVIELDLSYNDIAKLPADVFKSNLKLRILNLSYNKLRKLEDYLFSNMTHLQKVVLSHNQLQHISSKIFDQNCPVQHIDISNNRLKSMDDNFLNTLNKISSLTLEGNPWNCDCNLAKFRQESIARNLITSYNTHCNEPERLKGRIWTDEVVFACSPVILTPAVPEQFEVMSTNYTISCKVHGVPSPDIDWVTNGKIVDRDPRQNVQKYVTNKAKSGNIAWNNLTIVNFNHRDRGEYKCVAKNPGGVDEKNITLLHSGAISGYSNGTVRSMMPILIGFSVGAVILIIIIIVLTYCCCRRSRRDDNMAKNRSLSQSNEFISLDHTTEMGKALITEVNPVVKPPRQPQIPASVISGGTEVSETKKMLDEDSIYGDEDLRSADYDNLYHSKLPNNPSMDYRGEGLYPPDLLPYNHRTMPQVSPAGSSASTVPDTSRLPAYHAPQSPVHTPIYDVYRTLPYSRSHSPFTTPHIPPPRVPRQGGYVTVPRRPRQSWSSEPPTSDIGEPLYDNLGLRTTATGSSVLSLNKLAENAAKTSTPKPAPRVGYPLSPTIDPIAEHEAPHHMAQTLPRSLSAHRALSPNTDALRANWARSPEPLPDSRRESTASLLPTPDGKTPKIPPRPPPKPKKRTSTGPLFEDEGEDGTEV